MKMIDEIRIKASRDDVFAALNDPEILSQAIPGCKDLKQTSETELTATVQAKVGPVKATFKGTVTLSNIKAPESYTISGSGKGGAAGFAKGSAQVTLLEDGKSTILKYEVNAEVGGKLAQVGSRLIEGSSKKLANEFFETFSDLVGLKNNVSGPTLQKPLSKVKTAYPNRFILLLEALVVGMVLLIGFWPN